MNTPPDKPPTRESVEAAQRFAASLPALPEPQEKQPSDYERGFADHADFFKTWMQEQADRMNETVNYQTSYDEYMALKQYSWAFRYVLERYNERNQAGLRKAAKAL